MWDFAGIECLNSSVYSICTKWEERKRCYWFKQIKKCCLYPSNYGGFCVFGFSILVYLRWETRLAYYLTLSFFFSCLLRWEGAAPLTFKLYCFFFLNCRSFTMFVFFWSHRSTHTRFNPWEIWMARYFCVICQFNNCITRVRGFSPMNLQGTERGWGHIPVGHQCWLREQEICPPSLFGLWANLKKHKTPMWLFIESSYFFALELAVLEVSILDTPCTCAILHVATSFETLSGFFSIMYDVMIADCGKILGGLRIGFFLSRLK